MPRPPSDDEDLGEAVAEAEAAEAELRRMKESLIPRDRADALKALMQAELRAMITQETAMFKAAVVAAKNEDEARALLDGLAAALAAGVDRIKAEMQSQAKAWTLAGLEDRTEDDAKR